MIGSEFVWALHGILELYSVKKVTRQGSCVFPANGAGLVPGDE